MRIMRANELNLSLTVSQHDSFESVKFVADEEESNAIVLTEVPEYLKSWHRAD